MRNSWNQTLTQLQAAGPALTNSTSQTSVLTGQAKFTMPAGFLQYIGDKVRIKAGGIISTAASSPGTFSWFIMFTSVVAYAGGASGTLATSASNAPWKLEIDLTVRSVGNGTLATTEGSGKFESTALSATTPVQILACPAVTSPGFDSTVSFLVDLQGQWSAASASNTITCQDYELISLT
jgi:hypothetical protein